MIQSSFNETLHELFVDRGFKLEGMTIRFLMANPDQKTIFFEEAYEKIKAICIQLQNDTGASDIEVTTLLRELTMCWEEED